MDSTLERSIRRAGRSGKLPHSVIFSGSGDLTAAARFYAAALECTQQDRPCLRCPACSKVLGGSIRMSSPPETMTARTCL